MTYELSGVWAADILLWLFSFGLSSRIISFIWGCDLFPPVVLFFLRHSKHYS